MDKVSIIVPIYNGEKYLERCLDSLVKQTYKNIEILCLNDGSTDGSIKILKKYQKKDNRIIVIDKENSGVSDTRNIGIDKASGKYICFCDCDDLYEENYIELMYNSAKDHNVDIVKCNYKVIDTNNNLIDTGNINDLANRKYSNEMIKKEIIPKCLDGSIPCFCYLIIIKKSALKALFPLDIAMMEDVVFYLRLLIKTKNMYIIDDALYTIMYNPEGATNNTKNYERNILNTITVNKYIKDELNKNNILTDELSMCLNVSTLNSISDFIFKYYLAGKKDTIKLCKNIRNDDYIKIVDTTNLELINIQRKLIIKYIKEKKYNLLKIYMSLRKIIYKLRRH